MIRIIEDRNVKEIIFRGTKTALSLLNVRVIIGLGLTEDIKIDI